MELAPLASSSEEYFETDSGNRVSRKSVICGSQNIVLVGHTTIHPHCIVRGDLPRTSGSSAVMIAIGKYCQIGSRTILRPPYKTYRGVFSYYPTKIGDFVIVGENCNIQAASIGSYVHIGNNCIIGRFAIIKDCVKIADNTIIPPGSVIPSFSVYAGKPGVCVDELPECIQEVYEARAVEYAQRRCL